MSKVDVVPLVVYLYNCTYSMVMGLCSLLIAKNYHMTRTKAYYILIYLKGNSLLVMLIYNSVHAIISVILTKLASLTGIGGVVAALSGGIWLDRKGFVSPFWFLLCCTVADFVYIAIRLDSNDTNWLKKLKYIHYLYFHEIYLLYSRRNTAKPVKQWRLIRRK